MSVVRTDQGALVCAGTADGREMIPYTEDQAKSDASERNRRAEKLGIETRYVVADE